MGASPRLERQKPGASALRLICPTPILSFDKALGQSPRHAAAERRLTPRRGMAAAPRVVVAGGSLGGLSAALWLRDAKVRDVLPLLRR